MTPDHACEVLGLDLIGNYLPSPAEIDESYKRALKAAHPDTGGSWPFSIDDIKEARRCLLSSDRPVNKACPMCGGSGRVAFGFGSRECGTCHGTGEVS